MGGSIIWMGGSIIWMGGPIIWMGGPIIWMGGSIIWMGGSITEIEIYTNFEPPTMSQLFFQPSPILKSATCCACFSSVSCPPRRPSAQAEKDVDALAASSPVTLGHPKEEELALHLTKLPEALEDMLEELAPNRCDLGSDQIRSGREGRLLRVRVCVCVCVGGGGMLPAPSG